MVIVQANKFVVSGRLKHLLNIDPPSRERSEYYAIWPYPFYLPLLNYWISLISERRH